MRIFHFVVDPQQRNNSKYLPHLVDHMKGFLLKVKYFPNIVTPQKPRGGVATTPIVPRWGISLCVRPRVERVNKNFPHQNSVHHLISKLMERSYWLYAVAVHPALV